MLFTAVLLLKLALLASQAPDTKAYREATQTMYNMDMPVILTPKSFQNLPTDSTCVLLRLRLKPKLTRHLLLRRNSKKDTLVMLMLITLTGDVELNPGPVYLKSDSTATHPT